MAARDMRTTAARAEGRIPKEYHLKLDEITALVKRARALDQEESLQAIITAFQYGFVMGSRATAAGKIGKL